MPGKEFFYLDRGMQPVGTLSAHARRHREMGICGAFFRNHSCNGPRRGITSRSVSSSQGDPRQIGTGQGPAECVSIGAVAFSVFDGIYACPGWMRDLPAQAQNLQEMVLAGGRRETGLRGSFLSKYQLYCLGCGDIGVNTLFEEDSA